MSTDVVVGCTVTLVLALIGAVWAIGKQFSEVKEPIVRIDARCLAQHKALDDAKETNTEEHKRLDKEIDEVKQTAAAAHHRIDEHIRDHSQIAKGQS